MDERIPRSTRALLDLLTHAVPGPALDVGSFEQTIAGALNCPYINNDLTACRSAAEHRDDLPPGPYSTIFFDAREFDPGLAVELVGQAAQNLAPGGVLITTARASDLARYFAEVTEFGEACVARAPRHEVPLPEWPTYSVTFQEHRFELQSAPGIFSPRQMDEGTRFMLDLIEARPGAAFLDLGCGVGVVSRIASDLWDCHVTAVDVNARALRITAVNAPKAEVVASNGFSALQGREYDLIASNPPYHTDFAVGKAFIEGAHRHLRLGGILYLVVKRSDWYEQKVRGTFGGCRVVRAEHGYTVLIAEKRALKTSVPAPPPMTKKHAKRMAQAKHKKPGPPK